MIKRAPKSPPVSQLAHQVDIHFKGESTTLALVLLSTGQALAAAPISVPEPSSLAVLAAAIGGVAWAKFRRRK